MNLVSAFDKSSTLNIGSHSYKYPTSRKIHEFPRARASLDKAKLCCIMALACVNVDFG